MRYIISRTSSGFDNSRPCADAVFHESDYTWFDDGFNYHGGYWTIDDVSIEELYERFGQLVVQSPSRHWKDPDAPKIEVEIYDDWRE